MDYYERNTQKFIESTLELDMSSLYAAFEKHLRPGAKILDLGCGPGRDLKYFNSKYQAIGLEPSPSLASFAKEYTKAQVIQSKIEDFESEDKFDGIWACASLLHVPSEELSDVFRKINHLLSEGGVLFASFKYGNFEGMRNGRYFTDLTEESLLQILEKSHLEIAETWITEDLRKTHKGEKWLNIICVPKESEYNS